MNTTTVGVDLAKNVFVACVADGAGRVIETREFNRSGFMTWLSTLPRATLVAMEACGGAHGWGRTMQALGLEPRLMAAEFVRPYRKRQAVKNDRADAAAIVAGCSRRGCASSRSRPRRSNSGSRGTACGWAGSRNGPRCSTASGGCWPNSA